RRSSDLASRSATTSDTAGCAGSRSAPPTSPARPSSWSRRPPTPWGADLWCRLSISRLAVRLNTTVHTGSMCPTTSGVTMTGSSTQGIKTVLHPVSDLATAKAVYAALLGVPPQTDGPYYVGFEAAGQHIGLLPGGGPQGMTSPVAYWHVPDIEAK